MKKWFKLKASYSGIAGSISVTKHIGEAKAIEILCDFYRKYPFLPEKVAKVSCTEYHIDGKKIRRTDLVCAAFNILLIPEWKLKSLISRLAGKDKNLTVSKRSERELVEIKMLSEGLIGTDFLQDGIYTKEEVALLVAIAIKLYLADKKILELTDKEPLLST